MLQLSAGACATGAGIGTGCDDHPTIDIDGVRIRIVQIETPAEKSHVRFLISIRRRSRASDYESGGRTFESFRARQIGLQHQLFV